MSENLQSEWNWSPAVRRRLGRIEKALHASIGSDARFASGAGRQGGREEAFLDGEAAFEQPSGDDVLGYGGAPSGEDTAGRREASNSGGAARTEEGGGRLKPTKRGLETLQAIVAELTQQLASGEAASSSATKTEGCQHGDAAPADPETSGFDLPEGAPAEADATADEPAEKGGGGASEQPQGEQGASGHEPLDFEEMLKLIEELQNQPRETPREEPPHDT